MSAYGALQKKAVCSVLIFSKNEFGWNVARGENWLPFCLKVHSGKLICEKQTYKNGRKADLQNCEKQTYKKLSCSEVNYTGGETINFDGFTPSKVDIF